MQLMDWAHILLLMEVVHFDKAFKDFAPAYVQALRNPPKISSTVFLTEPL